MLVTISVVMLLGAMVVLAFGRTDRARVEAQAAEFALFVTQTRQLAAETGQVQVIAYDARAGRFSTRNRELVIDPSVTAEANAPDWPLSIRPSGETGGAVLALVSDDVRRVVVVDWLSGRAEVKR